MMTRIQMLAAGLAGLAAAGPAAAQVDFHSIPTANTCPYPWAITLQPQPPIQTLGPGASMVINRRVTALQTPHGRFVPAVARQINPGNLCFFENCTVGMSISLTCAPIGAEMGNVAEGAKAAAASRKKITVKFNYAKSPKAK